jgi:RNA-directed DNA polymerase
VNRDTSTDQEATATAAGQLAGWLKLEAGRGSRNLADILDQGLPGAWPGKEAFLHQLGSRRRLLERSEADLAEKIAGDLWFQGLVAAHGVRAVRHWRRETAERRMEPRWEGLPVIATVGELAEWLGGIPAGELFWFAGVADGERRVQAMPERGRHYHHRWIPRKSGAPPRLLASPKPRLKAIQRQILHRLLDLVPLHEAAHGFRRGRSIRSFAEPHTGMEVVLRADLADFFPSIRFGRVASFFVVAGYPVPVARLLAGLCCHAPLLSVIRSANLPLASVEDLRRPHLPQGAPTSPALSNAVVYRLDRRLAGLAEAAGAKYTRYADDLAFSGGRELRRGATRFLDLVAAIVMEEGLALNFRKTRVMAASARQRLAGVVVNEKPNTTRALYDELKATLHRWETRGSAACLTEGVDESAFANRLRGRIAALAHLNPEKGERLRDRFDRLAGVSGGGSGSPGG